jgi:hypothetical protein
MEDKVMMKDWKYPLTNIGKRGNCHQPRPTAKIRDAEGRELMSFAGLPYRRNHEAVAMASEFCEVMNRMYKQRSNCDVGTAEEQGQRFTKVCTANSRDGVRGLCSESCPFGRDYQSECALAWAQLPYESEVAE